MAMPYGYDYGYGTQTTANTCSSIEVEEVEVDWTSGPSQVFVYDDQEACKEEPEEDREHCFGLIRLPPARRILRKRRPAQRQSEYG